MDLFAEFKDAADGKRTRAARRLAWQLTLEAFPKAIQQEAQDFLARNGNPAITSPSTLRLLNYATVHRGRAQHPLDPSIWIPWRVIRDGQHEKTKREDKETIIANASAILTKKGKHALHDIENVKTARVRRVIKPYFDSSHYTCANDDLAKAIPPELGIDHYFQYGIKEASREPNQLFKHNDFWEEYPWARSIPVSPLYLYLRWPEAFSKYTDYILRLGDVLEEGYIRNPSNSVPQIASRKRTWANQADEDYARVAALIKQHSGDRPIQQRSSDSLSIDIVIPDFETGGGGHMTIFRLVSYLESKGHDCTIWVKDYNPEKHSISPGETINTHYTKLSSAVLPLSASFVWKQGDALIATSWDTAEFVELHKGFSQKFYFIQDYEPYFFAHGAKYHCALNTYSLGLKAICASEWLHRKMIAEHNAESVAFQLSYDPRYYYTEPNGTLIPECDDEGRPIIRIAVYARSSTPRRGVELVLEALSLLPKEPIRYCIELFGCEAGLVHLPRNAEGVDHGILSSEELGRLYRSCHIGIALSCTNHSLVPQEMIACGLAVIELDTPANQINYPTGTVLFAEANAAAIAAAIVNVSIDADMRRQLSYSALEWVRQTSWDNSFGTVEQFIQRNVEISSQRNGIQAPTEEFYRTFPHHYLCYSKVKKPLASVVIPTLNGGDMLNSVVESVLRQNTDFAFELIIIDSGSSDESIANLKDDDRISIIHIPPESFQHGRTRNLGVALAKGDFVAFLTQDALPADQHWLSNLIRPLRINQGVVAVFGRHRAHTHHSAQHAAALDSHFAAFTPDQPTGYMQNEREYFSKSPSYRQQLHFYSDNNSCLRKSTWIEIPYPDIDYGEDQLWANLVIERGYLKTYAADAVVHHSHEYSMEEILDRSTTEAGFFYKYFGYSLWNGRLECENDIERQIQHLLSTSKDYPEGLDREFVSKIRARHEGHRVGLEEARFSLQKGREIARPD